LHIYPLALKAPKPPRGSFDAAAARRGKAVFEGRGRCATCHVSPLYTEPGHNLHTPAEIGIDAFQAERSPARGYRTAPLAGLWTHGKGGYYHDGRFPTLAAVIDHYEQVLGIELADQEETDLAEYLKSL
jgi:cytochrome c peroxidase